MRDECESIPESEFAEQIDQVIYLLTQGRGGDIPAKLQERVGRRLLRAVRHGQPLVRKTYAKKMRERRRNALLVEAARLLPTSFLFHQRATVIASIVNGKGGALRMNQPAFFDKVVEADDAHPVPKSVRQIQNILDGRSEFPRRAAKNRKSVAIAISNEALLDSPCTAALSVSAETPAASNELRCPCDPPTESSM